MFAVKLMQAACKGAHARASKDTLLPLRLRPAPECRSPLRRAPALLLGVTSG
jgi:hypothetical protein